MSRTLHTILLSTAVAALTLAPLPAFMPIGSGPAFAERGGNGNGKGGERGNGGEKGNGGNSAGGQGQSKGAETSAAKGGSAKGGERSGGDGPSSFSKASEVEVASGKMSKRKSAPAVDDDTEVASLSPKKEKKASNGALASELKGLNAYHASEQAFLNASADSQVGRIAAYRDAALELAALDGLIETRTQELTDAREAEAAARALQEAYDPAYAGPTTAEIDASIAALDPASETYEADLAALEEQRLAAEAFETGDVALAAAVAAAEEERIAAEGALTQANTDVEDATKAEQDALMSASNGRELSPEALSYLREQLGL